MDLLDTLTDDLTTRCALGIHDASAWEMIKKNSQDSMPQNDPATSDLNLLVGNVQQQAIISRLGFTNSEKTVNYSASEDSVKLACKLVVFDFNFNMFLASKYNFIFGIIKIFKCSNSTIFR